MTTGSLSALECLWSEVRPILPRRARIMRIGVTLLDATHAGERQIDILLDDDEQPCVSCPSPEAVGPASRRSRRRYADAPAAAL